MENPSTEGGIPAWVLNFDYEGFAKGAEPEVFADVQNFTDLFMELAIESAIAADHTLKMMGDNNSIPLMYYLVGAQLGAYTYREFLGRINPEAVRQMDEYLKARQEGGK